MSNHIAKINTADANNILNNVFDSCNVPPSAESFDDLVAKSRRKMRPIRIHRTIATIFLFFVILSPLFFRADSSFSLKSGLDTVAVSSHSLYENCFTMTLTGDADYDKIYAKKNDGAIIFPDTIDSAKGVVIFPYDGDPLNIYIPSINGGCIQAVLSENK